jgi:hypothetical protein
MQCASSDALSTRGINAHCAALCNPITISRPRRSRVSFTYLATKWSGQQAVQWSGRSWLPNERSFSEEPHPTGWTARGDRTCGRSAALFAPVVISIVVTTPLGSGSHGIDGRVKGAKTPPRAPCSRGQGSGKSFPIMAKWRETSTKSATRYALLRKNTSIFAQADGTEQRKTLYCSISDNLPLAVVRAGISVFSLTEPSNGIQDEGRMLFLRALAATSGSE